MQNRRAGHNLFVSHSKKTSISKQLHPSYYMNDRYKKLYKGVFEPRELKKTFSYEHDFENTTASAALNAKSKDSDIPLSN